LNLIFCRKVFYLYDDSDYLFNSIDLIYGLQGSKKKKWIKWEKVAGFLK